MSVGVVENIIDPDPFCVVDGAAEQKLVECAYRPEEHLTVAVQIDRGPTPCGEDVVRGRDDGVQVIQKGAVPVPDDVPDRSILCHHHHVIVTR